jgi:acylphosphatase
MSACRRYLIRGHVQGVGYRYFVQKEATRLGLRGWVRNLDDGRVEALAEGNPATLADLEGALHRGPRWSEVRGVEIFEEPLGAPAGFSIR